MHMHNIFIFYSLPMFLLRKINMFTLSGLNAALLRLTKCPAVLKIRSAGTLDAGTHKYFFASFDRCGKTGSIFAHQQRGLVFVAGSEM